MRASTALHGVGLAVYPSADCPRPVSSSPPSIAKHPEAVYPFCEEVILIAQNTILNPTARFSAPLRWGETNEQNETVDEAFPRGAGGFRLGAYHRGERSKLSRRQFSGKAVLDLHDTQNGRVIVAIGDIGSMSLAYVRSTGHDVVLSELQRPNLLVVLSGTLVSRNEKMSFKSDEQPWLLVGRGTRETTVLPARHADYEALVLSMPPDFLGGRLSRLEAQGGMAWGDASSEHDVHLARLTQTLATQLSLCTERVMDRRLADAWSTILVEQMNGCLDACLGVALPSLPQHLHEMSLRHVRAAEELIYERVDEIRNVKDIAVHVGVSERTLQAAFRKVRGVTPTQVLAQARLHRARRALLDRDGPRTVSEVCHLCGIEHHGRFSKHYKEAFGENPVATLNARRGR